MISRFFSVIIKASPPIFRHLPKLAKGFRRLRLSLRPPKIRYPSSQPISSDLKPAISKESVIALIINATPLPSSSQLSEFWHRLESGRNFIEKSNPASSPRSERLRSYLSVKYIRCSKTDFGCYNVTEPPIDAPRDPLYKTESEIMKVFLTKHYRNRRANDSEFVLDFEEIYVIDSKSKSITRVKVLPFL
ncbi:uncharacterized protein LOC109837487 [Asparagus officinalis]|uniref:uncharacterized protein LOC109837487 n=1 Tax=Asparagus officinalis TaxID=4686 RepID=UPI00098E5D2E|nr:uncharacterized protein LOC109837487 [Asparagus officinalis]